MRPYDHPALEHVYDGHRECRVCGAPVTGIGQTLRHYGEAVRPNLPNREDAAAFREAFEIVEKAFSEMLAANTTDADLARVAVESLYEAGALHCRRRQWRRPLRAA